MIAHFDALPAPDVAAVEAALMEEPLASLAEQTVSSFLTVSEALTHVGRLTVDAGQGQPLPTFQTLVTTYQTLVIAQAALAANAQQILAQAEQQAAQA